MAAKRGRPPKKRTGAWIERATTAKEPQSQAEKDRLFPWPRGAAGVAARAWAEAHGRPPKWKHEDCVWFNQLGFKPSGVSKVIAKAWLAFLADPKQKPHSLGAFFKVVDHYAVGLAPLPMGRAAPRVRAVRVRAVRRKRGAGWSPK